MGFELTGLEGKVAVITGAGRMRSIGRQIALGYAHAGVDVVITGTGRPPERYPDDEKAVGWRDIASVADEVSALGRRALPVVSDVSSEAAVRALLEQTLAEFGRVDFVINNAAFARGPDRVPAVEMPIDVWDAVVRINLRGTFLMSKLFGQHLIEAGRGGVIINISSIAGKMLPGRAAAYAATKAGVQALAASMAQEVGVHGIRVNAVCPGFIDTFRMDDIRGTERWGATIERIPLRRPSAGEDVPNMVLYLCSDQGAWVTGQSINVDGGMVVNA
jgi:NAD(P)-dependent dehydrogenase (short-subunit alcohol dehydrogenase family)